MRWPGPQEALLSTRLIFLVLLGVAPFSAALALSRVAAAV